MFLHVLSRMYISTTFYPQNPALEIADQQKSVNVYLHTHVQRERSAEELYSSRLCSKNPVFEIVREESVKVYHLHTHVQREYSAEPFMRRILCH